MRYRIARQHTKEGRVPGLPGCWSQGAAEEEALANIEDAIREYLAVVEANLTDPQVYEVEVPSSGAQDPPH